MNLTKVIDSGTLNLTVHETNGGYSSVDELIEFASRKNAKRGFLFVSKILGKHIPVKPSLMRESYNCMANMLGTSLETTLVVGMSETATGMGGGIADSLAHMSHDSRVYFQHTTRHLLDEPEWFRLDEDHSHAVSHIVYEPSDRLLNDIVHAKRLVLADDEISTGKTLLRLAKGYMLKMNEVTVIDIVALVSWLDDDKTKWFMAELESFCNENELTLPKVNFHHLLRGSFTFEVDTSFDAVLPANTDKGVATEESMDHLGRCGVEMPISTIYVNEMDAKSIISKSDKNKPISIVGTGEHLYYPFLVAEQLELNGFDVVFQSTTRSPVFHDGNVIKSIDTLPFQRIGQEPVQHYIYNLDKETYQVEVMAECSEAEKWYSPLAQSN